jgi:hypothetical protein
MGRNKERIHLMAFAEKTKVSVDQSRAEVEKTLLRYGAKSFAYFTETRSGAGDAGELAVIMFEAGDRRIRFDLTMPMPSGSKDRDAQVRRQRWRALLLCIKAKLESVASKIETFEEAFLAHVVMPDGSTVGAHTKNIIARSYEDGSMQPLLPAPSKP